MTNFYKRYIYKNGVKHGPYYYSNKKVDGKVISTYLGTSPPTSREFKKPPKLNVKLLIIILSIISVSLAIYLSLHFNLFSTGNVPAEISKQKGITATVPGEEIEINKTNITKTTATQLEQASTNTIQGPVFIGKPVSWKKEVTLPKKGPTTILVPSYAENIVVYKIDESGNKEKVSESSIKITAKASAEIELNQEDSAIIKFFKKIATFFKSIGNLFTGKAVSIQSQQDLKQIIINENSDHYIIEYTTSAPTITEEETNKGKKITVSNPELINYKDILIYTNLNENLNIQSPESVKVYWVEQSQYIQPEKIEDKNSNGIYDYIEFIAPLSNQTYEIIVITKAEHLDSNRVFISDIYDKVKELDDVWSEAINDNEYVRVTFEKNLTSENDITIYPRITSGSPKIEVYEKDKNETIAEFNPIRDNEYNTIYLSNLQKEQDTFDLRVLGGSLQFDHIVDPYAQPGGTPDLRTQICYGEDNALQGSLGMACDGSYPRSCGAGLDLLSCNDGTAIAETHTSNRNNRYGGIGIQSYNSSVTNCQSINQVYICYERWTSSTSIANCDISVDANGGVSFTVVNSTCPGATANLGVVCNDVTSLESWNCGNFFGASGIRSFAKSEFRSTSSTSRTMTWDVLFFNVTYTADTTGPVLSNANTNTSSISLNNYFCLNVTATDSGGVSQVLAQVYNTTSWLNYTMSDTGISCAGIAGDNVYGVQVNGNVLGSWLYGKVFANDSFNNWNSYDFADLTINVISNQPPTVDVVGPILPAMPVENSTVPVNFNVQVSDPDGYTDISNVNVNFTYPGEAIRTGSCLRQSGIANTAIYSCVVNMQYYDISGNWNVNVAATDSKGASGINNTAIFTYNELKSIVITSPIGAMTWPTLNSEDTNISSDNDPVNITNTGNANGPVFVTAYNLTGETNPEESIPAINFRAGTTNGAECGATQLQEAPVWIVPASLAKGSDANPHPRQQIYFCLRNVPLISSQTYSAKLANAWVISI